MISFRLLALLAVSGGLPAVSGQAPTLANNSPFLPRAIAGTQGIAKGADALELRGVMSGLSGYLYYVYDPVKRHGVWTGLNDMENSFTIVAGDAKEGYLEIRMNDGRLLHLKLREAKTLAGEINSAAAPVVNAVAELGPPPARLTEVQAAWREELRRRLAENAARN